MNLSPKILEAVDAGVEWLDENLPDWRQYVDPVKLNMGWEESCVLGQYYLARYGWTNFNKIVNDCFGGDTDRALALGFLADWNYYELDAAWVQKFVELGMLDDK